MSSALTIILVLVAIGLLLALLFFRSKAAKLTSQLQNVARERNKLKKAMADIERMEAYGLQKAIAALKTKRGQMIDEAQATKVELQKEQNALQQKVSNLNAEIGLRQKEVIQLDEEILLQSFGFYKARYDLENSEQYKKKLDGIRDQQKKMIKGDKAAYCTGTWVINDSAKEGEKLVKDYVKLILRSFNNECDASMVTIKFSNISSIEKKLKKAFEALNKLGERMNIIISQGYLDLKLQELYLCYEYAVKKQEEKEEQQRLKAQMREEAKILKEIEEARAKLEKEEKHFTKAIKTLDSQLRVATTEAERQVLLDERHKIEQKLVEVGKDIAAVEKREQSTRAGYVYVISNIGSFGENVYKIGMTRRLDPQERVDELGDASVPFEFDVHALIFSEDAPKLENALHKAFEMRRVNMVNRRREFFRVALDEIERVVKTNFNKPVEFTKLAEAEQYRQSIVLRGEREPQPLFATA